MIQALRLEPETLANVLSFGPFLLSPDLDLLIVLSLLPTLSLLPLMLLDVGQIVFIFLLVLEGVGCRLKGSLAEFIFTRTFKCFIVDHFVLCFLVALQASL